MILFGEYTLEDYFGVCWYPPSPTIGVNNIYTFRSEISQYTEREIIVSHPRLDVTAAVEVSDGRTRRDFTYIFLKNLTFSCL